ncbi:MAG: hypothetical protein CML06_16420 [Pseudomonadales bacterium]|nr:hypothetical protein [Pseudomonadales bacterium]
MAAATQTQSNLDRQIDDAKRMHLAGDLKPAQKEYAKLLKKAPGNQRLLSLYGGLLLQMEQYRTACDYLRRACAKNQSDPDLPYNLGLAYYHLQQFSQAVEAFDQAIARRPDHDRAHFMKAKAYLDWNHKQNRDLALQALLQDIEHTDRLEALSLVAEILHEKGRNEEARGFAKQVLAKDPSHEIGLFVLAKTIIAENYSKALVDIKYAEPVIKAGNLILKCHPQSWRGHHVIAEALAMIGENALALEHYQKVNERVPGLAVSRTNAGVLLLRQCRLKEGWEEISHRKTHGAELYGMDIDALDRCPAPLWQGELEVGKTLLIASEQGIGDQILHSQMLREVLAAGVEVTMTCTGKIKPLMSRSLPQVRFYDADEAIPQPVLDRMDYKAELLDLGRYLRDDLAKFGKPFYYLRPNPELQTQFVEKYRQFGNKLKVGISWRSVSKSVGSIKSTRLSQWGEILNLPHIQFVNVQYGPVAQELAEVKQSFGVDIYQDDFDPFNDIEKACAQLSALDLVISVSNASVHLAGQLQIPTWVVLNSRPLWHWFESGDKTVWYETMKLYRQQQLQGWEPVLSRVADDLLQISQSSGLATPRGGVE